VSLCLPSTTSNMPLETSWRTTGGTKRLHNAVTMRRDALSGCQTYDRWYLGNKLRLPFCSIVTKVTIVLCVVPMPYNASLSSSSSASSKAAAEFLLLALPAPRPAWQASLDDCRPHRVAPGCAIILPVQDDLVGLVRLGTPCSSNSSIRDNMIIKTTSWWLVVTPPRSCSYPLLLFCCAAAMPPPIMVRKIVITHVLYSVSMGGSDKT
jgi:hypothetical protein